MILEGQENMRTLLANIDKNMLELSGRVERLATVGSAPQITGQAQVGFLSMNNRSFFERFVFQGCGW